MPKKRAASVLDMFMEIPQETYALIDHSFLNDKMKRTYKRVIEEQKNTFHSTVRINFLSLGYAACLSKNFVARNDKIIVK